MTRPFRSLLALCCAAVLLSAPLHAARAAERAPFPAFFYAAEGVGKILGYDASGRVTWEYPAEMSRDVWRLPSGNILFCYNRSYDSKRQDNPSGVMEVTPDKKIVFQFETTGQVWACQRLATGETLVGAASQGKLLLVDARGKITRTIQLKNKPGHSCIRHARALENGNFLVAEESAKTVREYAPDGRVVREIVTPFAPFSVQRLPGGNTIISGKDGIIEVDPAGAVVWRLSAAEIPQIGVRWLAGFQLLPSGNLLVVNAGGKVPFFEVTRDAAKKIVWSSADYDVKIPIGHGISLAQNQARPLAANAAPSDLLAGRFHWRSSAPLIAVDPPAQSIKDPTVVFDQGRWHLYTTLRLPDRPACMEYLSFTDWAQANAAPRRRITLSDAYHCAPQLFYFTPQKQWYLLYQITDKSRTPPSMAPAVSKLAEPGKPETLSPPIMLFDQKPANLKGWIDFWIICDAQQAYLFFTSDDGRFWRSQAPLASFPRGWSQPVLALRGDIFEASCTYRLKGLDQYLTIIEAQRAGGVRYFKAYLADRLDGEWRPLADTFEHSFASSLNVSFAAGAAPWTDSISHGELLRDGVDETMTIDPAHLKFLYQGCSAPERARKNYGQFPWRLGLLELAH